MLGTRHATSPLTKNMEPESATASTSLPSAAAPSRPSPWVWNVSRLSLVATSLAALLSCPHSKVEESFHLQATHDLFYHGVGPAWRHYRRQGMPGGVGMLGQDQDGLGPHEECRGSERGVDFGFCVDDGVERGGEGVEKRADIGSGEKKEEDELPYDHIRYPGVVPRTFLGAFLLSSAVKFFAWIIPRTVYDVASHPMVVQALARFFLLLLSVTAHFRLAKAAGEYVDHFRRRTSAASSSDGTINNETRGGEEVFVGPFYLLITACQFHVPFYSSRMIPNTFALLLVTHAHAEWLGGKPRRASSFLVIAAGIFRCDVLILLFTCGLVMLMLREMTIVEAIVTGLRTGVLSVALTVPLDSILWGRWSWPELEVLLFNTVDNRSSDWGTMPWHWYASRALPRAMLLTLFLVPLAFFRFPEWIGVSERGRRLERWGVKASVSTPKPEPLFDFCMAKFFVPVLGFIALYSFLPHKEMRFVFPAMPILNVCAAYGLSRLVKAAFSTPRKIPSGRDKADVIEKKPSARYTSLPICLVGIGTLAVTLTGSTLFLVLSKNNYPGGVALERLRSHIDSSIPMDAHDDSSPKWRDVHVHIDVTAAMTGVSLFGQRRAAHRTGEDGAWRFTKAGYEEANRVDGSRGGSTPFTHLLTEDGGKDGYHVVGSAKGYPRLDIRGRRIATEDVIYILERDDWHEL